MGPTSPATTLPMPLSREDSQHLPIKSIFPATVEQEAVETDGIVHTSPTDARKNDSDDADNKTSNTGEATEPKKAENKTAASSKVTSPYLKPQ